VASAIDDSFIAVAETSDEFRVESTIDLIMNCSPKCQNMAASF
jgi:hypothetical protein